MNNGFLIGLLLILGLLLSACAPAAQSLNNQAETKTTSATTPVKNPSIGLNKGQNPPDFTVATIDGKKFSLSQLKEDKKPVLIYFWATWCPFCKKDFSALKNVFPEYKDKLIFIAMDLDTTENAETIRQYMRAGGITGVDFTTGDLKVLSDFKVTSTTTKFALGADGSIIYKGSGAFNEQQWSVLLDALLATGN
jgi:thiol-disulfide isomerase/thioredoxin